MTPSSITFKEVAKHRKIFISVKDHVIESSETYLSLQGYFTEVLSPCPHISFSIELMHIKTRNTAKALKGEMADGGCVILNLTNPGHRLNPTALASV